MKTALVLLFVSIFSFANLVETYTVSIEKIELQETGDFSYTGGNGEIIATIVIDGKTYPLNLDNPIDFPDYTSIETDYSITIPKTLLENKTLKFQIKMLDKDHHSFETVMETQTVMLSDSISNFDNLIFGKNKLEKVKISVKKSIYRSSISEKQAYTYIEDELKVKNLRFRLANIDIFWGQIGLDKYEMVRGLEAYWRLIDIRDEIVKIESDVRDLEVLIDDYNLKMLSISSIWPESREMQTLIK